MNAYETLTKREVQQMKFRKMKCMIVLSFCLVLSGCENAEKRDTENTPADVSGEAASIEYSDDFPVELQEMLVYQYSGIGDGNNNGWEQYKADCEIITLESSGDIPFEDIVKAADINSNLDKISMQAADIDGDGIDEYVINDSIGRGQLGCIYVVKNVDEKWTLIGGGMPDILRMFADCWSIRTGTICWSARNCPVGMKKRRFRIEITGKNGIAHRGRRTYGMFWK